MQGVESGTNKNKKKSDAEVAEGKIDGLTSRQQAFGMADGTPFLIAYILSIQMIYMRIQSNHCMPFSSTEGYATLPFMLEERLELIEPIVSANCLKDTSLFELIDRLNTSSRNLLSRI